jgi:alpha-L-fucosidase
MNIGPRSDGTIPEEQQQLLLSIGKWLSVNGEAIYGTRPWTIFGEGPTQNVAGSFIDSKVKDFTEKDIRFTTKGNTLFAITLAVPKEDILIKSLAAKAAAGKVSSVELVGSSEKIVWSQNTDGLKIKVSKNYPTNYAVAYRIFLKK